MRSSYFDNGASVSTNGMSDTGRQIVTHQAGIRLARGDCPLHHFHCIDWLVCRSEHAQPASPNAGVVLRLSWM